MNFLYYTPGPRVTSLEQIHDLNLGYAFDAVPDSSEHTGPADKAGCIFTRDGRPAYYGERQTWRKIPDRFTNGREVWVGYTERPTPEELARTKQLSGHDVCFEDGSKWRIPAARKWEVEDDELSAFCALPPKLILNENGTWSQDAVKDRYARLWELARSYEMAYAVAFTEARDKHEGPPNSSFTFIVDFDEWDELAIEAMKTNYYVSHAEVDLLGIFDQESRKSIVEAVIDEPTWREWSKKNDSAQGGLSSLTGLEESTQERQTAEPLPVLT